MTDRPIHRRDFLSGAMGAAGLMAMGAAGARWLGAGRPLLPVEASLTSATAADLSAIKHVVFLMQENRSFDHYFGALQGVNGFFSGSPALDQAWPGGAASTLSPFHLDTTTGIAECTNDLDHSWQSEHASWNGGAMDSFVSTHVNLPKEGQEWGTLTMGYYDNTDIPYYYALAQAFTICDMYFCSVLGPTHPNRLMQMTGTLDPAGVSGGPILTTSGDNKLTGSCSWPTMPEILQNAGVSWKVYNPYGPDYIPNGNALSMAFCKNPLFYMSQFTSDTTSALYQNAFNWNGVSIPNSAHIYNGGTGTFTAPAGGPNHFLADVKANTLPQVSWIISPTGYDEHPPAPASLGEWYTSQVVKTLMSNKAVWDSTVLFIMYDENDGWFDHVAPPTAPAATPGEYVTAASAPSWATGPIGLGFRVPMIVVSPFSQGGWVCSDVFDHTSQLKFLASVFGAQGFDVDGTVDGNVSAWRQAAVGDLTAALPNLPLPTTLKGVPIYPKKPALPHTSDKMNLAPVDHPAQCTSTDLVELGGPTTITLAGCKLTNGSAVVKSPYKTSFINSMVVVGQVVSGTGIPAGTTVSVLAGGSITLSAPATASGLETLSFFQAVPTYPVTLPQSAPTEVASVLKPTPS